MPLVTVTGLPTSGKSTRAKQLYSYLTDRIAHCETPKYRLHLISDTSLSISRAVYDLSPSKLPAHTRSANASEKDARAALYGAVKRVLTDRDIVILDSLNYIKGWRYQLYCEAKAVRTPSVVLQIGCSVERAKGVNEARLKRQQNGTVPRQAEPDVIPTQETEETRNDERDPKEQEAEDQEEAYEPANWENLVFRYEEPNAMNRWDSPIFTVIWEDDASQTKATFDALWDAIAGEARKVVKPNQATVQRSRAAGGDYLYILDRETQEIVKRILEQQAEEGGGSINVSSSGTGEELIVELPAKKLALPQLQRMRRAFVGLNRGGIGLEAVGDLAAERIRGSFVGYLNDAFEKDE